LINIDGVIDSLTGKVWNFKSLKSCIGHCRTGNCKVKRAAAAQRRNASPAEVASAAAAALSNFAAGAVPT
jgi:hypothetical protein